MAHSGLGLPFPVQAWRDAIPKWTLALYRKPRLFLLLCLVLPLLLICSWLYAVNERQWRAQEEDNLLMSARLAARTLQEELLRMQQLEAIMGSEPNLLRAVQHTDRATIRETLHLFGALVPEVSRILITDAAGRLMLETPDTSNTVAFGAPPALPAYDASASPAISPVTLYDEASGEKAIVVSTALHDGQQFIGTLHVQVRLGELSHWFANIRIGPAGFIYVVDAQGLLVSHPFQLLPGQPKNVLGWTPVRADIPAHGRIIRFRQEPSRAAWTAGVARVEPFGWRVVAQQPDAAMLKPFYQLAGSLTGLIVLLALLIGWAVLRWSRMHHATLRLLAQQAQLLKHAEQERVRRPPHRADEPETEHDAAS